MSRKAARILPSELLRDLDAIQKAYFDGLAEVERLRTALRAEEAKRLAAERQRDADAAEIHRLRELRQGDLRMSEQATTIQDQLKTMSAQYEADRKAWEKERKRLQIALEASAAEQDEMEHETHEKMRKLVQDLEVARIQSESAEEKAQSLANEVERLKASKEKTDHMMHKEYERQIQDLQSRFQEREKALRSTSKILAEVKQQYSQAKKKLEDHVQESAMNRNADIFRVKLVKLKKENDELRKQLRGGR